MPINFSDPAHTQHDGTLIPISNQELFDAGLEVLLKLYLYFRIPWGDEALTAYEAAVRQGWTLRQIVDEAFDRYETRHLNIPSGANPPVPLPDTDTDPAKQARDRREREGQPPEDARAREAREQKRDGREDRREDRQEPRQDDRQERAQDHPDTPTSRPADRPGRPGAAQRE